MSLTSVFAFIFDRRLLFSFFFLTFIVALPSQGALTGYLKIPDIPGESKSAEHENEIDFYGISWNVKTDPAESGSGRTRARAEVSAITVLKNYDSSSPYLFLAVAQGKAFDEITFTVTNRSGEGEFAYLQITLTNCVVTNYEVNGEESSNETPSEEVSFDYEKIKVLYTVQADDHSAGDEHEIEYDVLAGV